jgi:hypothetical protein
VPIIHNVKMNKASNELVELKLEESETARKIDDDESTMIM